MKPAGLPSAILLCCLACSSTSRDASLTNTTDAATSLDTSAATDDAATGDASTGDASITDASITTDTGAAPADATIASPDANTTPGDAGPPPFEDFPTPIPNTMLALQGGLCVNASGTSLPLGAIEFEDDCTVCQCTTYGWRCARREACTREVCVFADGTIVPAGDVAIVAGCFDCACNTIPGSCTRRTVAPCPEDACVAVLGPPVPLGEERFQSECHRCRCDAAEGFLCENLCHPWCHYEGPNGEELTVADQHRIPNPEGCGSCACDYSKLRCDLRGCPD